MDCREIRLSPLKKTCSSPLFYLRENRYFYHMKSLLKQAAKIKVVYNPALNNTDVSPAFQKKIEETNKILSNVKMPDAYYEQQRKKSQGN